MQQMRVLIGAVLLTVGTFSFGHDLTSAVIGTNTSLNLLSTILILSGIGVLASGTLENIVHKESLTTTKKGSDKETQEIGLPHRNHVNPDVVAALRRHRHERIYDADLRFRSRLSKILEPYRRLQSENELDVVGAVYDSEKQKVLFSICDELHWELQMNPFLDKYRELGKSKIGRQLISDLRYLTQWHRQMSEKLHAIVEYDAEKTLKYGYDNSDQAPRYKQKFSHGDIELETGILQEFAAKTGALIDTQHRFVSHRLELPETKRDLRKYVQDHLRKMSENKDNTSEMRIRTKHLYDHLHEDLYTNIEWMNTELRNPLIHGDVSLRTAPEGNSYKVRTFMNELGLPSQGNRHEYGMAWLFRQKQTIIPQKDTVLFDYLYGAYDHLLNATARTVDLTLKEPIENKKT